jgi:WD40 repeat protein
MSAATQLCGKEEEQRQGRALFEKGFITPVEWNTLAAEIARLKTLVGKSKEFHELTDGIVYSVAASPDGKLIVAATKDATASVRVWKLGNE